MFTGATAEIRGTSLRKRGGFRGLACGFDGLADGPLGIPGVTAYTLRSGNVVYLPSDWNSMSSIQKLLWIESSDLPAKVAAELEGESSARQGFSGLGDAGPDLSNVYKYVLPSGYVLYLPINWNRLTAQQKLDYIAQSNLPAQFAIELEDEAGISDGSGQGGGGGSQPPSSGGSSSLRPNYDYVRAGDVVRVAFSGGLGSAGDFSQVLGIIAPRLGASNLSYVNGSAPGWFSTAFTIDVQARGDFSHLADVASIIASLAQGPIIVSGVPTAAFVSKVEATGGQIQVAQTPGVNPAGTPPPPGDGYNFEKWWKDLTKNLGGSSNLLLLGGAGVLLLVVLAKK